MNNVVTLTAVWYFLHDGTTVLTEPTYVDEHSTCVINPSSSVMLEVASTQELIMARITALNLENPF